MPAFEAETLVSVGMIAVGVVTVVRRRRLGENAARRRRFWEAKEIEVGAIAFDYGVLGWVFVALGLLGLLVRSIG